MKERDAFAKACNEGVATACNNLGTLQFTRYRLDKGTTYDAIPVDDVASVKLFERACNAREMAACTNLGIAHLFGHGVALDPAKAKAVFEKAVEPRAWRCPERC